MSDFKIIGNPNPVVGVLEIYTVNDFFEKVPSSPFNEENSFSYNPVFWEVYVLELGKWRKTKENDKRGNKVSYTFLEKSLTRNGIRILARKGDKVARLDIKPLSAQPKIDHIELLDKNGAKIKGRLSYGQTVKARVFCFNMERRRVSVTMWEDDVKGAGHNKANEKNFIETLSGIVKFGKADIDFLLKPSFAKIAERRGHEKDKIHEFYVTAEYNDGKIASNNINVNALETPVAPYKGKTTPHQAVKNKTTEQKPKNDSQKPNVPTAIKAVKGKINAVHITDIAGNQIKGVFKEKQIKVWINSTGLTGKEVRLKLYDEDLFSNDLLFTDNFTIKSDLHTVTVPLDTIPRSLGGSNWAEGNEQQLFAEIEVLQTHDFIKSAIVDVDATVFKQDPVETTNKVLKVDVEDSKKDEKKKSNCYCNRDFTLEEFTKILEKLRDSESIVKKASKYTLFGSDNCELDSKDKTIEKFYNQLNIIFKKYNINTCLRKIHFLSQVYLETDRFRTTKEYSEKGEYKPYFGRGLMQLTWQSNYEIYKAFSGTECVDDYEVIANNLENAFDSAGWYWKQGKVLSVGDRWTPASSAPSYVTIHKPNYPKNKISYKKGDKNINYGTVDFSLIADDDKVDVISYLVNGGSNGLYERRNYVTTLKNIFKFPQECDNKVSEKVSTDTINDKAVTIRLIRKWETKKSTIGEFTIDGSEIKGFILEEKGPDTTISGIEQRIPIGTYNLAWHNGTKIKKGLKVYNSDVSKDRAILIHSGNTADDTEGCLLPGSTRSVDFVGNSKNKLKEIFEYIEEKGIDNAKIIITQKYE
ncbi:Chitinase class I [Flavobacterium resistens]|uniref:Chitinase class I n=1 Tax=Flavobacterium resistens TaxID=443612 RepID=A0A521F311_9FLAO|nr:DUF5675 family protein [Flavobacterium resistens]MRX69485.1 hypothetical protein [Flavobacterium resistens]SMO90574.1 Chitinase class I [Flavobacterium resistens]